MKRVYYNDSDPKACEWIRELIKAGLVPDGEVDERPIEDVKPADVAGFSQCHFFAGIAGWAYALKLGNWGERPVWSGSCPCQPFSAAGQGKGFADERHLWPAFFWLIEQCRPECVLGEQVASPDGVAWLDLVSTDLEGAGYAIGSVDTPAAGYGAPHIRQRLYWMAHAGSTGRQERTGVGRVSPQEMATRTGEDLASNAVAGKLADSLPAGRAEGWTIARDRPASRSGCTCELGNATVPGCAGRENRNIDCETRIEEIVGEENGRWIEPHGNGDACLLAISNGGESSNRELQRSGEHGQQPEDGGSAGGLGIADSERCDGIDTLLLTGQPQQAGSETAGPSPTNGFWADAEWIHCRPEPKYPEGRWRPVEPGTFPLASGVSGRVGLIRGYGNALCIPQAKAFCEAAKAYLSATAQEGS